MAPIEPGQTWRLTVVGRPVGQGSMSAVPVMRRDALGNRVPVFGRGGMPVTNVTDSKAKKLRPWRQEIAQLAAAEWGGLGLGALDEPFAVSLAFYVERPADHYGAGRNAERLKDSAPLYPERTGDDLDKLERGVLDALTGIVWRDDRRVVTLPSRRRYGSPARVEIRVRRLRVRTVGELRALRGEQPELADALAEQLQLSLGTPA